MFIYKVQLRFEKYSHKYLVCCLYCTHTRFFLKTLISSPNTAVTICADDTNLHCPTADVLNQCPHTILYRSPEGALG